VGVILVALLTQDAIRIPVNVAAVRALMDAPATSETIVIIFPECIIILCSPIATHYFPNLYHLMYEFEDGRTKEGGRVRYGFDQNVFYDFSWRGYAIFSRLQVS
jgi:hypothetical protein